MNESQSLICDRMLSTEFYLSPLKFVLWAYPWGEGALKGFSGPRKWQREDMLEIEAYLANALSHKRAYGTLPSYFQYAMASGRGPGKSAFIGMLTHWFRSTRIGSSAWVAANGEPQLRTKTFPEIAKWATMAINAEFFDINAMSIVPSKWFKEYIESPKGLSKNTRYYYTSGQLWSEENPDAFAGAHNFDGEMALFDEASGIPDKIWTVQEGVFTEDIVDRFWLVFSNPRKPAGAFYECFHANSETWRTRQIDSREVEGISHTSFDNIIKQFGEDSDEARVEVKGQFPKTGDTQYIETDKILAARKREVFKDDGAPLVMGIDVARFGHHRSVFSFRRGRDARTIPWQVYRKLDIHSLSTKAAEAIQEYNPDAVFIDGGGVGGGVIDNLKAWGYKVIEVQAAENAENKVRYYNKSVECVARVKEWLETGSIPDDKELHKDLRWYQKGWQVTTGQLTLNGIEGTLESPDAADALALTFTKPVARKDMNSSRHSSRKVRVAKDIDYPMFGR
jgi:hypothetical protein